MKRRFLSAINSLVDNREEFLENCRLAQETLCDCEGLEREIEGFRREQEAAAELARQATHDNARLALRAADDQDYELFVALSQLGNAYKIMMLHDG